MSSRMFRLAGIAIPVVALACGSWAYAQQPQPKPEPKPTPAAKPAEPQKEEGKDIVAAATAAKLTTFVELVKLAGLADDLKKPGPFTVFAPTDEAFKAYKDLDDLKKPENKAKLADFLKGHVVAKKVDAKVDKTAKPMAGAELKLAEKDGKVTVNEAIKVTKTEKASNGEIMIVDKVIAGAAEKKPEMKKEEPKKGEPMKEEPKKPEQKKPG